MTSLRVLPITYREACAFIERHHRHHPPARGQVFALAAAMGENIVGVATAGRPVSRHLDKGLTLEVTRVATDGTRNACSFLYGAMRRVGREMGYIRFVTYTLPEEGGASLRGSGWVLIGEAGGGSWTRPSRPRVDCHPTQFKLRWEA